MMKTNEAIPPALQRERNAGSFVFGSIAFTIQLRLYPIRDDYLMVDP